MARCMSALIWPRRFASAAKSPPDKAGLGSVPGSGSPVEIPQRSERQCPTVGPAGEVLLAEGEVTPVALPAHQRQRHVGEPGTGQG